MATANSGSYTPESLKMRRRLAEAFLDQGLDTSPIGHWTQGAARMLKAALGGYGVYKLGQEEKELDRQTAELLAGALGIDEPSETVTSVDPGPVSTPSGDTKLPRSLRTNNPGAINYGSFAKSAGATGTDGRLAVFPDMETGYNAMNRLLDVYEKQYGLTTPRGIISRWAPPNVDNNSTNQYIANVSKALGIGPDDPIPPEKRRQLIEAMARYEAGTAVPPPPGGAPAPAAPAAPVQVAQAAAAPSGSPDILAPLEPQSTLPDREKLRAMLANPRTRAMAAKMILDERKRRAELNKPTDELREYRIDMLQRQALGEPVIPFGQWKAEMRKAGATRVSVDTAQETSFNRERGKQQAQRLQSILTAGELARTNIANLDAIEAGLNAFNKGSFFGTGAFAPYELEFRRFAQSLGIGNADALAGAELANAVRNRMALMMRNPDGGMGMPGALSDADREFLKESQPGIERTPEGNAQLIEILRRMERRKIEIAELANAYVDEHGNLNGFDKVVREYAERNPLFADLNKPEGEKRGGSGGGSAKRRRYNPATGMIE